MEHGNHVIGICESNNHHVSTILKNDSEPYFSNARMVQTEKLASSQTFKERSELSKSQ
jgi:hypothetical protein